MIDKSLVKKRFSKSLSTYDENAAVQKIMADKLIRMLPLNKYTSIFEAGCATGILTRRIVQNISFSEYTANDIVGESKTFIDKIVPENNFITGDIESFVSEKKYDLIISNACLQWCSDIETTIEKLVRYLNKDGVLAVSVFGDSNLSEIQDVFNLQNKSYNFVDFKAFLTKYNAEITEDINELLFDSPVDVLKHIKNTGVNAIKEFKLTKSKLELFEEDYRMKYSINGKVRLTYNPVYIIIKKDDIE